MCRYSGCRQAETAHRTSLLQTEDPTGGAPRCARHRSPRRMPLRPRPVPFCGQHAVTESSCCTAETNVVSYSTCPPRASSSTRSFSVTSVGPSRQRIRSVFWREGHVGQLVLACDNRDRRDTVRRFQKRADEICHVKDFEGTREDCERLRICDWLHASRQFDSEGRGERTRSQGKGRQDLLRRSERPYPSARQP